MQTWADVAVTAVWADAAFIALCVRHVTKGSAQLDAQPVRSMLTVSI